MSPLEILVSEYEAMFYLADQNSEFCRVFVSKVGGGSPAFRYEGFWNVVITDEQGVIRWTTDEMGQIHTGTRRSYLAVACDALDFMEA